jgi:hypothetical protein
MSETAAVDTARLELTEPSFTVKIALVTLAMVLVVIVTPLTLTSISVYNVQRTVDEYVPARVIALARSAALTVDSELLDGLQRSASDVAGAFAVRFAAMENSTSAEIAMYPEQTAALAALCSSQATANGVGGDDILSLVDDAVLRPAAPGSAGAVAVFANASLSTAPALLCAWVSGNAWASMAPFAVDPTGSLQRPTVPDGCNATSVSSELRRANATLPCGVAAMRTSNTVGVTWRGSVEGRCVGGNATDAWQPVAPWAVEVSQATAQAAEGNAPCLRAWHGTDDVVSQCVTNATARHATPAPPQLAFRTTLSVAAPVVVERRVQTATDTYDQTVHLATVAVSWAVTAAGLEALLWPVARGNEAEFGILDMASNRLLACVTPEGPKAVTTKEKNAELLQQLQRDGSGSDEHRCAALHAWAMEAAKPPSRRSTTTAPQIEEMDGDSAVVFGSHRVSAARIARPVPATADADAGGGGATCGGGGGAGLRWYAVVAVPQASYLELLLLTRARLVVTAFCIGAVSVVCMLLMMRSIMHPLSMLSKVIACCASMRLDDIELMEASAVAEIADIQRSVAYLAIRLYHYARFLPDRVVLQAVQRSERRQQGGGADSDSSADSDAEEGDALLGIDEGKGEGGAPVHSIQVRASYDGTALAAAAATGRGRRSCEFIFKYRITDAVHGTLLRLCRVHLNERPGEVLTIFVQTPDGKRQLTNNEDVLFAIEYFANSGELASINLTVMKSNVKSKLPGLIAAATILSASSRLLLAAARMSNEDQRVQIIGLLLLACLSMQLAQNTLVTAYLTGRFAELDSEFRAWKKVSNSECRVARFFGAFNVTNMEILGCHMHVRALHFTAPLSAALQQKIRKYSLMGFLIGDLVPFVIIVIETVLRRTYRDYFVATSLFFSVVSVVCILSRHGIIRFVVDVAVQRNKQSVRDQSTKTMQLARKDVTLLRVSFADEEGLTAALTLRHLDSMCELANATMAPIIRRFGGMLIANDALTFTAVFNAHTVIPNHAEAGLVAFLTLRDELRSKVLPVVVRRLRHAQLRRRGGDRSRGFDVRAVVQRHRPVCSIVSGEMCMGYIGTLTSQCFQHVDEKQRLSRDMLRLNTHYGTTVLVNADMLHHLQTLASQRRVVSRQVDTLALHLSAPGDEEHPMASGDYDVLEVVVDDVAPRDAVPRGGGSGSADSDDDDDNAFDLVENPDQEAKAALSRATVDAVKQYRQAMAAVVGLRNASMLARYCHAHPADVVARRVLHWARFLNGVNEVEAITFPRPITPLGLQLHACELPGSRLVPRQHSVSDVLRHAAARHDHKEAALRPSRTARRARDPVRAAVVPVLEQVIGQTNFSLEFEVRDADAPVIEL